MRSLLHCAFFLVLAICLPGEALCTEPSENETSERLELQDEYLKLLQKRVSTLSPVELQARIDDLQLADSIVGDWIGGGGPVPIFHTFSANGSYWQTDWMPDRGRGESKEAKWEIFDGHLVRNTNEVMSASRILKFEKDFFQIRDASGNTWGYHRHRGKEN